MNTRGLPGMFAPVYQEFVPGISVVSATALTWATQPSCASAVGSIRSRPSRLRSAMQSVIHSACCSIDRIMLEKTDGLPGPVTVNRLGNPATISPR